MSALDTIIRIDRHTSRAVCDCGTRFEAFGLDPSGALAIVAMRHDEECADLQAAAAILRESAR